jgi:tetratricopeptide (TPR) repeat protein/tRNA A-37 threonylcarbamoyl transferase component Bud32
MGLGEALAAPPTQPRRPLITPERWQQVKHLLSEALELDTAGQKQFLDSACANDTDLRAEVDLLLAERVDTGSDLMEQCAADASLLRADPEVDGAPTANRIGPYRILREIGRGGMGAVYLAERDDEHYRQQVAIKLIKPGLGGDVIRRRFRNEMQILAELNHANIARLFDGGETADGVPYLVMEYVEGSPINRYCDEQQLSTAQRLNLFCTVCAAVQYAHQHLVIHRDIKPGNILVTSEGVPKLVDFGIAKLLDQGTFGSDLTATAVPFMTPQYASPEQLRGESVTTATDVYSLGVVLYELLSGRLPYRFKSRVPHEIAKAICDDDPERPSTAMVLDNGAATQIPKRRKRLHADLDNIVLMAMRKEPQRRYVSAEQFAEDIQRHLAGRPVRARHDTFAYRAGKFIRRQKVAVAAAALVAITLLVGIIATTWQARVARAERERSERRFNEVRQLANSIVFEVHDSVVNLPGSTPARSLIVQRGLKYLDSLAKDAAGDRGLQRELAAAYEKLGAVQYTPTVAHLGDLRGALESHHKAAALREALVAAEPSNRDYRRDLLDSYWFIATLVGAQGDMSGELEMMRQQLPERRELAETEQSGFLDRYNLAATHTAIGNTLMQMGDSQGALEHQREGLRQREQIAALDPDTARARRALTISYEYVGLAMDQAGDTRGALEVQQRGLEVRESLVAADPLNIDLRLMLNESHRYVGDLLLKLGDRDGARDHYRKQFALTREMVTSEPTNAQFRQNEAVALIKMGDVEAHFGNNAKALSHYQEALRIREQLSAGAKEDTTIRRELAEVWLKLAEVLEENGSRSQALENYRKSIETLEALSTSIPMHVGTRELLAEAQSSLAKFAAK